MDSLIRSLAGWTPVRVRAHEPVVEWAVLDPSPTEPFFEHAADRAMRRPFNAVFARETGFDVLDALADDDTRADPAGLIFHMSRCGLTLVTQMLGALPPVAALAEPQPFDGVIRRRRSLGDDVSARLVRGLLRAYDAGNGRRTVVKLHAWHVTQLPVFARAAPHVPWVFVFREPRAVLRSQRREPGPEVIPGTLDPAELGVRADAVHAPDYDARVLGAFCDAALRRAGVSGAGVSGGAFVDYAELPAAVGERVLPWFRIDAGVAGEDAMRVAASRNAKVRAAPYATDAGAPVTEAIDRDATRWLDAPYAALRCAAEAR